jgi:N-acetylneuraminic acid mutarotase
MIAIFTHRLFVFLAGLCVGMAVTVGGWRWLYPQLVRIRMYVYYAKPFFPLMVEPAADNFVGRYAAQAIVSHGKLLMCGGFSSEDLKATAVCEAYSPVRNAWERVADMPTPVTHAGIAEAGGAIWFAGGFVGDHPGPTTSEVWKYHPDTNSWSKGPPLPEKRAGGALVALGQELHYFGGVGSDRQKDCGDHWVLSAGTDQGWRKRKPMPNPRNQFGAVALNGLIYAVGGAHGHDYQPVDDTAVHVYHPGDDSWRELTSMPKPRSHIEHGTFIAGGRIFVAGGRSNQFQMLYDFSVYDPESNKWENLPALPEPLRSPVAAVVGDRLLIGGGATLPSGFRPNGSFYVVPPEQIGMRAEVAE